MDEPKPSGLAGAWRAWQASPLYVRILIALVLGVGAGLAFQATGRGEQAATLKDISGLVLGLLKALATPLIFLAILSALLQSVIAGKTARRMGFFLATNTLAAIAIGLIVVNIVKPGAWGRGLERPAATATEKLSEKKPYDPVEDLKQKVPSNVVKPHVDDNVIGVILLAVVFGLALRHVREKQIAEGRDAYKSVENFVATAFDAVIVALHAVIQLVPLAVFCVVAAVIGKEGFAPFQTLLGFIVAVLLALSLQVGFYLMRISLGSRISPLRLLTGGREALLTAFSTASSSVTMPITYESLRDPKRVGLREENARLGALVGSNFNNDGTALYEAMAPLFVAQALAVTGAGVALGMGQQVVIAFMAVVASVGAAGIPEAGLVTMLLVFRSVNLPTEFVLLLLPVDWFLDRCRTMVNVLGDMTVGCLLEGKTPLSGSLLSDDLEIGGG
jgi:Na+/H+-dicarboxylate symporter